ncbi:hypothetical protein D3C87_1303380 [compost metagenome]
MRYRPGLISVNFVFPSSSYIVGSPKSFAFWCMCLISDSILKSDPVSTNCNDKSNAFANFSPNSLPTGLPFDKLLIKAGLTFNALAIVAPFRPLLSFR